MQDKDIMNDTGSDGKDLKIEDIFKRLDGMISRMEDKDTGLEESFDLYKEGVLLLKECTGRIEKMEQELTVLKNKEKLSEGD